MINHYKQILEISKLENEIKEALKIDFYKINTYENAEMIDVETLYDDFISSYASLLIHADVSDYYNN